MPAHRSTDRIVQVFAAVLVALSPAGSGEHHVANGRQVGADSALRTAVDA